MTTATIELPPKLVPVFSGEARYRGSYGGRGSAKTRSFALMTAVKGYQFGMAGTHGQILCAREHLNSLDESSMEEIKTAIRSVPWLDNYYDIGEKYIRSKDGNVKYTFAGLRHNLDSIKSKARILLCWIDEAEPVTEEAWRKLIPTIREEGSEIWVTWNPESKRSATNAGATILGSPMFSIRSARQTATNARGYTTTSGKVILPARSRALTTRRTSNKRGMKAELATWPAIL